MAKNGIPPLNTLKECLMFLEWLNNGGGPKNAVVTEFVQKLLPYFPSMSGHKIALQNEFFKFLKNVSLLYKTLSNKVTAPSNYNVNTRNKTKILEALLACTPKFLAALSFIQYHVDGAFSDVGGGDWNSESPKSGKFQAFLITGNDIIQGGFDANELSNVQGSALANDLRKILNKDDGAKGRPVHDHFRNIILTTLAKPLDAVNTGNSVFLLLLFCELVIKDTSGAMYKSSMDEGIRPNAICWQDLTSHCKILSEYIGKLKDAGFSATGRGVRPREAVKFVTKAAEWFRENLATAAGKLSEMIPQSINSMAELQSFTNDKLYPRGFIFDGSKQSVRSKPNKLDGWNPIFQKFLLLDEMLRKLKTILDGYKCGAEPVVTKAEAAKPVATKTEAKKTEATKPTATEAKGSPNQNNSQSESKPSTSSVVKSPQTPTLAAKGASGPQGPKGENGKQGPPVSKATNQVPANQNTAKSPQTPPPPQPAHPSPPSPPGPPTGTGSPGQPGGGVGSPNGGGAPGQKGAVSSSTGHPQTPGAPSPGTASSGGSGSSGNQGPTSVPVQPGGKGQVGQGGSTTDQQPGAGSQHVNTQSTSVALPGAPSPGVPAPGDGTGKNDQGPTSSTTQLGGQVTSQTSTSATTTASTDPASASGSGGSAVVAGSRDPPIEPKPECDDGKASVKLWPGSTMKYCNPKFHPADQEHVWDAQKQGVLESLYENDDITLKRIQSLQSSSKFPKRSQYLPRRQNMPSNRNYVPPEYAPSLRPVNRHPHHDPDGGSNGQDDWDITINDSTNYEGYLDGAAVHKDTAVKLQKAEELMSQQYKAYEDLLRLQAKQDGEEEEKLKKELEREQKEAEIKWKQQEQEADRRLKKYYDDVERIQKALEQGKKDAAARQQREEEEKRRKQEAEIRLIQAYKDYKLQLEQQLRYLPSLDGQTFNAPKATPVTYYNTLDGGVSDDGSDHVLQQQKEATEKWEREHKIALLQDIQNSNIDGQEVRHQEVKSDLPLYTYLSNPPPPFDVHIEKMSDQNNVHSSDSGYITGPQDVAIEEEILQPTKWYDHKPNDTLDVLSVANDLQVPKLVGGPVDPVPLDIRNKNSVHYDFDGVAVPRNQRDKLYMKTKVPTISYTPWKPYYVTMQQTDLPTPPNPVPPDPKPLNRNIRTPQLQTVGVRMPPAATPVAFDTHPGDIMDPGICPAKYPNPVKRKLPYTDASAPQPQTVREILLWLSDLPYAPGFDDLTKHLKWLSKEPDHCGCFTEPVSDDDFTDVLSRTCGHASSVLAGIHGSGPPHPPAFHHKHYRSPLMFYAADPYALLCQLHSYVYAACHQLSFLRTQCRRDAISGGWRDFQFGRNVKTSEAWHCRKNPLDAMKLQGHNCDFSPLQGFLTDQSVLSTYWYDNGNICRRSHIKMGFLPESFPNKLEHGFYIYGLLIAPCYQNDDPLEKLCRYLVCLTKRTPRTTGELVSYFQHFGKSLYDFDQMKLSLLGNSLLSPHPNCPDWDYLDDSGLQAVRGIRGHESLITIHKSKHDNVHPRTLSTLVGCGSDPDSCPQHCSPITYRAYALYSQRFAHTYLSWAVYLPDRLWESLYKLFYELKKHDYAKCSSLHLCSTALPLLYLHGLTPPEVGSQPTVTCSDVITKLQEIVNGKPIASLMTAMDNFLYGIREPFIFTLVAVWSLTFLIFANTMLYRIDILHIRSHLIRTKASHVIDVKALLTKGRKMLSLYKDVDYFDDEPIGQLVIR